MRTGGGRAHFKVFAVLDASRPTAGTVTIDRGAGIFSVRPSRRRKVYELPLGDVASIVVAKMVKAEVAAKRAARRGRR